jgi:zinc transport system substrate-binding protein
MQFSIIGAGALTGLGLCVSAAAAQAESLNVVATIKPIHSIAAAVMSGVAEPKLLLDGTASPHTFSLKPSDAKALSAARVIFRVSDGLEPFMIKVARSLPKTVEVVTLEKVPGLTLHPMRTGGTFEDHDHGHGKGGKHKHEHGHSHGDSKNATDGHLYLDPDNAALIAAHMADILGKAEPASAERFKTNAEAFQREISALKAELDDKMKPLAERPFIVFHDAYQYFERRFGLEAAGSVTVSPEVAPGARRLSALRRKIGELKAVCVFSEPQFEPRLVATITEKTNARRGVLDPLGVAITPGTAHYATLLRNLATDLSACLKE